MFKGTTILAIKRGSSIVMIGDGQVTFGDTVLKGNARKIRRIYNNEIIVGFAGSTADAFTLFERFETKLEAYNGNLRRASVEMAKEWRTDKILRRLEAMIIVANAGGMYLLSGSGDVLEPEYPIIAIGSGGNYAYAAARALYENTSLPIADIAKKAMEIASSLCIYTNQNLIMEELEV